MLTKARASGRDPAGYRSGRPFERRRPWPGRGRRVFLPAVVSAGLLAACTAQTPPAWTPESGHPANPDTAVHIGQTPDYGLDRPALDEGQDEG